MKNSCYSLTQLQVIAKLKYSCKLVLLIFINLFIPRSIQDYNQDKKLQKNPSYVKHIIFLIHKKYNIAKQ